MNASESNAHPTLFGHPVGLYTLFFAEMWERFSYYGMRALLVFYMTKGFLSYQDDQAYAVYGAYAALVYAAPFIGGMIADRLLGARRSVILGGLLMSAGHLMMTFEHHLAFYLALSLLICGNGFFKPNISTLVGTLYPEGSSRRDGGFTIFYMGINLGAALAPLVCGYVGERYGYHYGFGLATIGMLMGVAVFVAPTRIAQALILAGAITTAAGMVSLPDNMYLITINAVVATGLIASAMVAVVALNRGGIPHDVGLPPQELSQVHVGPLRADWCVYLGIIAAIPLCAVLVQHNRLTGALQVILGVIAASYLFFYALTSARVERERLFVVIILTFFSIFFWAFFEQAGSSLNNFADRNVDRVFERRHVTASDIGTTVELTPTQEQLGFTHAGSVFTLSELTAARDSEQPEQSWELTENHLGMGLAETGDEIPASTFQSVNPIFIVIFGLVLTFIWGLLAARGLEPGPAFKFALGLLQLGLGFGAIWYGATQADERGMVAMGWLLLGYLLHTTGELCLSPVGLSMVTKLSPARIVSTVMGSWFLATAFANYLAGQIAELTGVQAEDSDEVRIPPPSETVDVYGEVFGGIAILAIICSLVCFLLVPLLNRWMHVGVRTSTDPEGQNADP